MRWIPVDSANLLAVGYDRHVGRLHVRFVAAPELEYVYDGVPPEHFIDLLNAASPGALFNRLIRAHPGVYPYQIVAYVEID